MISELLTTTIEYAYTGLLIAAIGEKVLTHPLSSEENNKKKSIKIVTLVTTAIVSTYILEKIVK